MSSTVSPVTGGRLGVSVPSALTRLTLRRERRSILAWSLGGGCLTLYCILMFNTMYATAEERQRPP